MMTEIVLLALAIPAGYLLAWMTRDELVYGREWFRALIIISVALSGLSWLFGFRQSSLSLIFIAIISFISFVKSKDKRWTKKRI